MKKKKIFEHGSYNFSQDRGVQKLKINSCSPPVLRYYVLKWTITVSDIIENDIMTLILRLNAEYTHIYGVIHESSVFLA